VALFKGGPMQTKVLAVLALLLLLGTGYQSFFSPTPLMPRQEEQAQESLLDVYYQASNESEESIIDLLWLHQAAKMVLKAGGNYFNIVEQNTGINGELVYMEGIIEMTDDLDAEFSAQEVDR